MKKEVKKKLPDGWKEEELKDMGKIVTGNTPPRAEIRFYGGTIPWIKPEDLDKEMYVSKSLEYLSDDGSRVARLLPKDAILVSCIGNVGKMAIAETKLATNQQINSLIVEKDYDVKYVYYALKNKMLSLVGKVNQALVPILNATTFGKLKIPIPETKDVQIETSGDVDYKIRQTEKMRQAALKQKEAISAMQGAILREVFPPKEGDKLPVGWKWEKLSDVCFLNPRMDRTVPRDANALTSFVPMDAIDEEKGVIAKIINRKYSEISKGYTFFAAADVLFAKITPCMQNGKSAIAEDLTDGIGFGSTEFHVFRPKEGTLKEWIYYFVRTSEFRKRAEDHFAGSAGQKRVPPDFLEEALIPMPPRIDEQIRIVAKLKQKVNEIEKMSDAVDKKLEAIEAIQGAILREVFDFQEVNN